MNVSVRRNTPETARRAHVSRLSYLSLLSKYSPLTYSGPSYTGLHIWAQHILAKCRKYICYLITNITSINTFEVLSFSKQLHIWLFCKQFTIYICYVMLCYVMLCYVMLCYVMLLTATECNIDCDTNGQCIRVGTHYTCACNAGFSGSGEPDTCIGKFLTCQPIVRYRKYALMKQLQDDAKKYPIIDPKRLIRFPFTNYIVFSSTNSLLSTCLL